MLLIDSSDRARSLTDVVPLLLLAAIPHGVAELLALLHRGRFQLRPHHVPHGLDALGDHLPLLPVPLLNHSHSVALVVLACHLEWAHHALKPELLDPLLGEVQVLKAPSDLILRRRLLTILLDRRADCLGIQHSGDHRTVVQDLSDPRSLASERSFPFVVDVLENVLVNLEPGAGGVEGHRFVALGRLSSRHDIGLTARPPVADHPIHPVASRDSLLGSTLVHHSPTRKINPVRVEPPDLEPRGLLLLARAVYREEGQFETELAR